MPKITLLTVALMCLGTFSALAQEKGDVQISVKDGKFSPATLTVPAGQKLKLIVKNEDKVQAEFESYKLDREQKIEPGGQTEMYIGPLEAGEYPFFDDNNPDAKGTITAK